jgi:hypothetical protein
LPQPLKHHPYVLIDKSRYTAFQIGQRRGSLFLDDAVH